MSHLSDNYRRKYNLELDFFYKLKDHLMMSKAIKKFSAGGVVIEDGKVLAMKAIPQNEIIFPKGAIETGETTEQTAIREVFEETGYKTTILAEIGLENFEYDENGKHYSKFVTYYLMKLTSPNQKPTPHRLPGEEFENLWLNLEEAMSTLTYQESKDTLKNAIKLMANI